MLDMAPRVTALSMLSEHLHSRAEQPAALLRSQNLLRWEIDGIESARRCSLNDFRQVSKNILSMLLFQDSNIPVVSRLQPWKWLPAPRNSMKIPTTLSYMLAYKLGPHTVVKDPGLSPAGRAISHTILICDYSYFGRISSGIVLPIQRVATQVAREALL